MKRTAILHVLVLALALLLTACTSNGDTVERFAEAAPGSGESINIPGYENLTLKADSKPQKVYLPNPKENAAYFVMTLTLEDGETLWTGKALYPGEAFTQIALTRSLKAGEYAAKLHYNCFSVSDNTPLNGAEVKLNLTVRGID